MAGVHLDHRLSPILEGGRRVTPAITTYLEAGCGFGGSCFPKDVRALIAHGDKAGYPMKLLQSVIEINRKQPARLMQLLRKHMPELKGKRIAVLGLAFKPGTDDMRESPAIPLLEGLHGAQADIVAFDPVATHEAKKVFSGMAVTYAATLDEAITGADAVIVVTSWPQFQRVPKLIGKAAEGVVVIDGRRMLDKHSIPRYDGIGL